MNAKHLPSGDAEYQPVPKALLRFDLQQELHQLRREVSWGREASQSRGPWQSIQTSASFFRGPIAWR